MLAEADTNADGVVDLVGECRIDRMRSLNISDVDGR